MVLIIAQAMWHFDLRTFMLLYTATFMISTLSLVIDLWRSGNLTVGIAKLRLPRRLGRSMMRYGLFTFGSGMATIALGNIDQLMVGVMLKNGLDNVAYYAVAFYIASAILIPARALVLPSMPILAEAWKRRDNEKIAMIYRRSAAIQLVIGTYLFLCLWAGADALYSLMEPGYEVARHALLILGLVNVINLSGGLSGGIVGTSRSYWFDAVSGVVLVVLNVVLDYILIKAFGMVGAAWSSMFSLTAVLAWRIAFLRKRHGLWPYDARTVYTGAIGVLLTIVLFMLPPLGPIWVDFILRAMLITAIYWPLVHVFRIAPDLSAQVRLLWKQVQNIGR